MFEKRTVEANGVTYVVDRYSSCLLQRGLIDPYDLSEKSNEWVVLKEYIFWSHDLERVVIIPRWFCTDLASVPRLFRPFISVNERHRLASLPHDLLYVLSSRGEFTLPRAMADKVLLTFCKVMGVPAWKRWAIYTAVRAGGWAIFGGAVRELFIKSSHRIFYRKNFPKLDLDLENGKYLIFKK